MVPERTAPAQTEKAASTLEALAEPEPMAPEQTEKAAATLEALASGLVDLSEPDLERLQATRRQAASARLCHPTWPRGDDGDKFRATS
jgi:hypothetical protein